MGICPLHRSCGRGGEAPDALVCSTPCYWRLHLCDGQFPHARKMRYGRPFFQMQLGSLSAQFTHIESVAVWSKVGGFGLQLGRELFGGDWSRWDTSTWMILVEVQVPLSNEGSGHQAGTDVSVTVMHLKSPDSPLHRIVADTCMELHEACKVADESIVQSHWRSPLHALACLASARTDELAQNRRSSLCNILRLHSVAAYKLKRNPYRWSETFDDDSSMRPHCRP